MTNSLRNMVLSTISRWSIPVSKNLIVCFTFYYYITHLSHLSIPYHVIMADSKLDQKLSVDKTMADTPAGLAWLEKYMHPPSTKRSAFAGIPDTSDNASVQLSYTIIDEQPVKTAVGLLPVAKALYVLPPSIMCQKFCFLIGPGGAVIGQDASQNIPTASIDINTFPTQAESVRFVDLGDTAEQDATDFNNNNYFYGAQFRPNISVFTDTVLDSRHHTMAEFYSKYSNHRGYKEHHAKSKGFTQFPRMRYHNGKHVAAGDDGFPEDDYDVVHRTPASAKPLTPRAPAIGNAIQVVSLGILPVDGGSVLMRNQGKSRSNKCKDGAYFVHRFTEPTQRYNSMARSYATLATGSISSAIVCFYEFYDAVSGFWFLEPIASSIISVMSDFEWYDMSWGLLLHDYSAGAGLPGVTPAPLRFKRKLDIEVQAASGSILQPLVTAAPMFDPRAMQTASQMMHCLPDMMTADHNLLGGLMQLAKKVMPSLLSSLSAANPVTRCKARPDREYVEVPIADEVAARKPSSQRSVAPISPMRKLSISNAPPATSDGRRVKRAQDLPPVPKSRGRPRSRSASRPRTPSRTRAAWGNRPRSNSRGRYE